MTDAWPKNTAYCRLNWTKQQGFTLLELLLAISLFALIASTAYLGLNTAIQNQQAANAYAQRTADLQIAVQRLEKDLSQAINRSVRNAFGQREAALLGDAQQLTFSRNGGGQISLHKQKRGQIQRLRYRWQAQQLMRDTWPVLDQGNDEVSSQALLTQVVDFSLRYLDNQGQWQTQWADEQLPKAIEINLRLSDIGDIQCLVELIDPVINPEKPAKPQANEKLTL